MIRRFVRRTLAVALVSAALAGSAAPAQNAAQTFYRRLLAEGSRALLGGDQHEAARKLRLAAFGLLEDPPALMTALVQLTLAQLALGDEAGASESLSRVLDVEGRIGAYEAAAEAGLSLDVRREFEELLVQRFSEPQLRDLGAFARLADVRLERDLAALGPAERRARLEELVAAAPDDGRWNAQLAQITFDAGELEAAIGYATSVLAGDPDRGEARCLRGAARAETGQCEGAIEDLAACPATLEAERFAADHVECLARLGRLDEATAALAALPPALRAERQIRRLERSVGEQIAQARRAAAAEERRQAQAAAAAAREAEKLEREQQPLAASGPVEQSVEATEGDAPSSPSASEPRSEPNPSIVRPTTRGAERATSSPVATGDRESDVRPNRPAVIEPGLPAAGQALAREIQQLVASARTVADFAEPLSLARELADRYPRSRDAQHLAAEIAYRASRWSEAVEFFRRGGAPDAGRPELSFYEAVARYETGDVAGARAALDRALPQIQRTPFVEGYVSRIRGDREGSSGR